VHGGWARSDGESLGDIPFNAKTSEFFRKEIQFPFFEHYLKGTGEVPPEAYMFETGTNVWRKYPSWPPPGAQPRMLYFHADGKLSFDAPSGDSGKGPSGDSGKGYDEYVSDPMHPVPFVPYVTDTVPQRYMVEDQRFASTRPDVLVYESDPLTEDVTIAGPITPKLKIASSGTDSDFDVKLMSTPTTIRIRKAQARQISASSVRRRCTWAAIRRCCVASRCVPSSAIVGRSRSR
jgi:hypothetical protein